MIENSISAAVWPIYSNDLSIYIKNLSIYSIICLFIATLNFIYK